MVVLRSSGVGAAPMATTPKRTIDLDTSSEFLSLLPASQRRSTRVKRSSRMLYDSFSSPEHNSVNVSIYISNHLDQTFGRISIHLTYRSKASSTLSYLACHIIANKLMEQAPHHNNIIYSDKQLCTSTSSSPVCPNSCQDLKEFWFIYLCCQGPR